MIGNQNPDDNYELMRIVVSLKGFVYGKTDIKAIALNEDLGFKSEDILRELKNLRRITFL